MPTAIVDKPPPKPPITTAEPPTPEPLSREPPKSKAESTKNQSTLKTLLDFVLSVLWFTFVVGGTYLVLKGLGDGSPTAVAPMDIAAAFSVAVFACVCAAMTGLALFLLLFGGAALFLVTILPWIIHRFDALE